MDKTASLSFKSFNNKEAVKFNFHCPLRVAEFPLHFSLLLNSCTLVGERGSTGQCSLPFGQVCGGLDRLTALTGHPGWLNGVRPRPGLLSSMIHDRVQIQSGMAAGCNLC